ncbi:MAG: lamin tail domain-containing protein [Patescibacteria group bacterium]
MRRLLTILLSVLVPLPAAGASPAPTPVTSPLPAVSAASVPLPLPGDLRINEFLPNPEGADTGREWIELKNVASHPLLLDGVTVRRVSGPKLAGAPSGTTLPAGGVLLLDDLSGSLINGGDTLLLLLDGTELDRVTYDKAGDDQVWSRVNGTEGVWTTTGTPGTENPATPPPADAPDAGNAEVPSSTAALTVGSGTGRTMTQRAAAGKLPKAGPGAGPYALAVALATLYAWQRTRHRS